MDKSLNEPLGGEPPSRGSFIPSPQAVVADFFRLYVNVFLSKKLSGPIVSPGCYPLQAEHLRSTLCDKEFKAKYAFRNIVPESQVNTISLLSTLLYVF